MLKRVDRSRTRGNRSITISGKKVPDDRRPEETAAEPPAIRFGQKDPDGTYPVIYSMSPPSGNSD